MTGRRLQGVLFDLDGTLLDSAPDLTAALNRVRADYELPPLPVETVRAGVSRGAAGMLGLGFPDIPDSEYAAIKQRFLTYYADGNTELSRPFPGVPALLEQLDVEGIGWAIVTNKHSRLTMPIVTELGWAARAARVVCGDTASQPKPDPAPILLACRALAVAPQQTVMIGDDPRDIQAGRAAGCATAAVSWGYGDPDDPGLRSADYQCRRVADIFALLTPDGAQPQTSLPAKA